MKTMLKLALLALPAAGCSTMKVSTNEMPGAAQTTARYETYAWIPKQPTKDESHANPFVEAHLKQAVDRDLAAKEYRRVEPSEHPDFLIGWHVTTARTSAEAINPYWGYLWSPPFGPPPAYGGGFAPPGTYAPDYQQGTLILDIVDARSNKLVWRGSATADLGVGATGGEAHMKVHKAVDKILAKFPPKD